MDLLAGSVPLDECALDNNARINWVVNKIMKGYIVSGISDTVNCQISHDGRSFRINYGESTCETGNEDRFREIMEHLLTKNQMSVKI